MKFNILTSINVLSFNNSDWITKTFNLQRNSRTERHVKCMYQKKVVLTLLNHIWPIHDYARSIQHDVVLAIELLLLQDSINTSIGFDCTQGGFGPIHESFRINKKYYNIKWYSLYYSRWQVYNGKMVFENSWILKSPLRQWYGWNSTQHQTWRSTVSGDFMACQLTTLSLFNTDLIP